MLKQTDEQITKKFFELTSRADVADILEIEEKSLRYFLYVKRPENMYDSFQIKKKRHGVREIRAPRNQLKNIQRKLSYVLSLIYKPKICAYGFIKNKSIIDNARNHTRKNIILNIDLKDFFTQIHFGRIRGMLKAPPYSIGDEAATTIAQIACYMGHLPQGAPSSPILSNMVCAPLDNKLMQFAKRYELVYSRYADDLTFSTHKKEFNHAVLIETDDDVTLGNQLIAIIQRNTFNINYNKVNIRHKFERQEATGIIVNRFPNVKRDYIRTVRALLNNCKTISIYSTACMYIDKGFCHNSVILEAKDDASKEEIIVNWFTQVMKGKISFIKQVKGSQSITYLKYAKQANDIFGQLLFDVTLLNQLNLIMQNNIFILEYSYGENFIQGSGFYVKDIGLFTSYHVTDSGEFYKVYTASSYQVDSSLGIVCKSLNEMSSDLDIDYAIYDLKPNGVVELNLGDSSNLKVGDSVIIAGYPNAQKGDTITKQSCEIIGQTTLYGATFFKVSGRIVHGASGGAVFNLNHEIIGIIKGGIVSLSDDDTSDQQGFVPIHLVIENHRGK